MSERELNQRARLLAWSYDSGKEDPFPNRRRKPKQGLVKSGQSGPDIGHLMFLHVIGADRFEDDSREYIWEAAREIKDFVALVLSCVS